MNLHEYSQTHNREMGILFSKQNTPEIYPEVIKELRHRVPQARPCTEVKAYCIRCGKSMDIFDPGKPLCNNCHPIWAKYRNKHIQKNSVTPAGAIRPVAAFHLGNRCSGIVQLGSRKNDFFNENNELERVLKPPSRVA